MENVRRDVKKGPRIPGQIDELVKGGKPGVTPSASGFNKQAEIKHEKSGWFAFPPDYKPESKR